MELRTVLLDKLVEDTRGEIRNRFSDGLYAQKTRRVWLA